MELGQGIRVLACGGREYANSEFLYAYLDSLHAEHHIVELCHGGATGADSLAGEWAISRKIPVQVFRADWEKHGRAAGPIRNREMHDTFLPDVVVAFAGGRGTADMRRYATSKGTPVLEPPLVVNSMQPPAAPKRTGL